MAEHDKPEELDKVDELDKLDEQKQQEWQARIAQKRLDLSQSVEEALADPALQEGEWSDEEDELDSLTGDSAFADEIGEQANAKDISLIPPRLSLQSKPMPVVRPDTPVQSAESSSQQSLPAQTNGIDSPLDASPGQGSSSSTDAKELKGEAEVPQGASIQQASSGVTAERSTDKPRLAGRTTKVLLKAIARSEVQQIGEVREPLSEEARGRLAGAVGQVESESSAELRQTFSAALFGSGMFKRGQGDVMIENPHITRSSVVVVMLTSDPGPVVVHYVSLYPQTGFTVHLSASAEREAGFNYVILAEK